ncbi:MAG: glycosyltransferase family 4 protein [Patescibacteria group bacterium]
MNILYVTNSGIFGGMEWHVYDLAKGMIENGHKVYIWCPEGPIVDFYNSIGAEITNKKIRFDIDPSYIASLKKFLEEKKIDVVHGHELKAVTNAVLAGYLAKTKVRIGHTHTPISEWRMNKIKKGVNSFGYSRLINWFSTVEIALTESRKKVKMKEGIKESKLAIIPNSLHTWKFDITPLQRVDYKEEIKKRYGIPKNAFVFGNVGRITEEKGHNILVEAFKKFIDSDLFHKEDFYLMLVGGGDLEEKVKVYAKENNIEDKVIITGRFEEEDKVKFYSAIDVFVHASLAEGFGVVLVEAMYNGLATICSDIDVLTEVGGDTVVYFETGNPNSLSEKMVNIYEKVAAEGNLLGERAKKRVEENFTMEKFVSSYLNLYESLLKKS